MLVRTNNFNKKGERIYRNALTGKTQTIQRVYHHNTAHSIPSYAFGFIHKAVINSDRLPVH